jgi:transposase InsO family protein
VDERLLQAQLVKRHERRKLTYTITRMMWGKRQALNDLLEDQGFRRLIQTAYIERVNLTIRQGASLLTRRPWSLPQTEHHLLYHVEWWRCYYHFIRPHETLRERKLILRPAEGRWELSTLPYISTIVVVSATSTSKRDT